MYVTINKTKNCKCTFLFESPAELPHPATACALLPGSDVTMTRMRASSPLQLLAFSGSFVSKMDSYPDGREYGSRAKRQKLDVGEAYSLAVGPMDAHRPVCDAIDPQHDSTEGNFPENMLLLFAVQNNQHGGCVQHERTADMFVGVVSVCERKFCSFSSINKFAFNLMTSVLFFFWLVIAT